MQLVASTRDPSDHPEGPIKPYQTLLLMPFDPHTTQWADILPPDSTDALRNLIQIAKPTKSFRELQVETDIPLSQLYRLSAHLVYWNKAHIINTLTKTNVYVLNSFDDLDETSDIYYTLAKEFSRSFPSFRFDEILERFSQPRTLGEHVSLLISSLQRDFIEVVIWMLQRNLIIQLHTYIYLMIPKPENFLDVEEEQSQSPLELRPYEKEYIENMDRTNPAYKLFKR